MATDEVSPADIVRLVIDCKASRLGYGPTDPVEGPVLMVADATEALDAKDGRRRLDLCLAMLSKLLEEGPALVRGNPAQRESNWQRCAASVVALWLTAGRAWRSGSSSVSAALSVTCLEETGKLAAERLRLWGIEAFTAPRDTDISRLRGRGAIFKDHLAKTVLAAMSGALINARVDRVIGREFVIRFLDAAEERKLEVFRQSCLYLDWRDGALQVPGEIITAEDSARYVALSGEVLADIQPDPAVWSRVFESVRDFEKEAGISPH